MKVYEVVFDENRTEGVYALSVVDNPAMQDMWIALNEHPQKIEFSTINEEKRLLLGAALIPNKKIYRNIDGNEFYVTFSEQTIEKLAHSFIKNGKQNNSSLNHEVKLEGMSVVEAWTVTDPNNDKSNTYGKTYEKGTWVTMMKVDNDEVWQKVKQGEIKGFSIDAVLALKELNLNPNINMSTEASTTIANTVFDKLKAFFTTEVVEPVAEVEAQPEAVAEVEEPKQDSFDVEAFKKELNDVLAQLSTEVENRIKNVELSLQEKDNAIQEKAKEVETLKAELSKQPEAEPVKPNQTKEVAVEFNAQGSLLELIRKNKN